jgi:hypothetical protein
VGLAVKTNQALSGATENRRYNVSFAPFRGSDALGLMNHGFTVGYYRSLLRSFGAGFCFSAFSLQPFFLCC